MAVKEMTLEKSVDLAAFKEEIKLHQRWSHKNIVAYFGKSVIPGSDRTKEHNKSVVCSLIGLACVLH
jgi:protein associated with RNAse G/E